MTPVARKVCGGKVAIGARAEAGSIVFVVEDTGVGISDEDLARVGEPYFQARASYDRRHNGTGLGLSIVKGLVRLHAGEINIRSRIGEGTRVCVRLPLDCEREAPGNMRSNPLPLPVHLPMRTAARPTSPARVGEEAASRVNIRVKKSA